MIREESVNSKPNHIHAVIQNEKQNKHSTMSLKNSECPITASLKSSSIIPLEKSTVKQACPIDSKTIISNNDMVFFLS